MAEYLGHCEKDITHLILIGCYETNFTILGPDMREPLHKIPRFSVDVIIFIIDKSNFYVRIAVGRNDLSNNTPCHIDSFHTALFPDDTDKSLFSYIEKYRYIFQCPELVSDLSRSICKIIIHQ